MKFNRYFSLWWITSLYRGLKGFFSYGFLKPSQKTVRPRRISMTSNSIKSVISYSHELRLKPSNYIATTIIAQDNVFLGKRVTRNYTRELVLFLPVARFLWKIAVSRLVLTIFMIICDIMRTANSIVRERFSVFSIFVKHVVWQKEGCAYDGKIVSTCLAEADVIKSRVNATPCRVSFRFFFYDRTSYDESHITAFVPKPYTNN